MLFLWEKFIALLGFPGGSVVKNLPVMEEMWQELQVCSLDQEGLLEKEMAAHSSILAWEIFWTEEPGWLQSMGLQKNQCGHSPRAKHPGV